MFDKPARDLRGLRRFRNKMGVAYGLALGVRYPEREEIHLQHMR